jgi:biopolymer transport protein ExbD
MRFANPRTSRRELSDINVTSLVDIIFNLLLFFLLTTSFSNPAGLTIDLPEASSSDVVVSEGDLVLALTRDGALSVGDAAVADVNALLKAHQQKYPEGSVLIQADRDVPHGRVVELIDAAKQQGIQRLGILAAGN